MASAQTLCCDSIRRLIFLSVVRSACCTCDHLSFTHFYPKFPLSNCSHLSYTLFKSYPSPCTFVFNAMRRLLLALLPAAALALTCVNKQKENVNLYGLPHMGTDETCETNKWCVGTYSKAFEGKQSKFWLQLVLKQQAQLRLLSSKDARRTSKKRRFATNTPPTSAGRPTTPQ